MLTFIDFFNLNFSGLFSWQVIFLICIGIFWLFFASIQDFKKREVENWWVFSLVLIVSVFRIFWSITDWNIWPFVWLLIGLALGFGISSALYYSRMFAAGDFKLLIAMFSILPLSSLSFDWQINIFLMLGFLVCFMFAGAIYGIFYTLYLSIRKFKSFKKEFLKQSLKYKYYLLISLILFIVSLFVGYLFDRVLVFFGILLIFSSVLLVYAKSVEEGCMNKKLKFSEVTIGDWLVNSVRIGNRIIKPHWQGLSEKEVNLIRKGKKSVLIRDGIPFIPSFLLGFILLLLIILL